MSVRVVFIFRLNTFDYLTIIMDSMENGDPQNLSESSLQTELKAFLENGIARSETEAMALGKFLKAASTFFNQELSALRLVFASSIGFASRLLLSLLWLDQLP